MKSTQFNTDIDLFEFFINILNNIEKTSKETAGEALKGSEKCDTLYGKLILFSETQ
jgi:hypothetical protein